MKAAVFLAAAVPLLIAAAGPSGTAGITVAQVARGKPVYQQQCAACHGVDLAGSAGAPPLKGAPFRFGWDGKSAGELFAFIKENMPPGQQGSLSDKQYADVLAAIIAANGVGPGKIELPAAFASLKAQTIRITPRPGAK